jgi:hypothetical protein
MKHLRTVDEALSLLSLQNDNLFGACESLSSEFTEAYAQHRTKVIFFTHEMTSEIELIGRQLANLPDYRNAVGYMTSAE